MNSGSTITKALPTTDFKFNTFGENDLVGLLKAANTFAADLLHVPEQPRWITFTGASGNGKTYLAKQLYRFWKAKRMFYTHPGTGATLTKTGMFIDWMKTIESLRDKEFYWVREIAEADFVVLDEIGAENPPTAYVSAKLFDVLNRRLNKWTVITSNRSVEAWAEIEVRISSRLVRPPNRVVHSNATDYALRTPEPKSKAA